MSSIPLFKDLRILMAFFNVSSVDDLFEGFNMKLEPLLQKYGCDSQEFTQKHMPRGFQLYEGLVSSFYQNDSNYAIARPLSKFYLELSFQDIYSIAQLDEKPIQNQKAPFKTYPLYIQQKDINPNLYAESKKLALPFNISENCGILVGNQKILINFCKNNFLFRMMRFNVLPILFHDQFPFSVIILFKQNDVVQLLLHQDLVQFVDIPVTDQVDERFPEFKISSLTEVSFNFIRLKRKFDLKGILSQDVKATNMQLAAHSLVCCVSDDGVETEKISTLCQRVLQFLPVLYESKKISAQKVLPDLICNDGAHYVQLIDDINQQLSQFKLEKFNILPSQFSVMSWNLQQHSAMFFADALQIDNPISGWRAYKKLRYTQVILEKLPDILLLSEAGPILECYQELSSVYSIVKTEMNVNMRSIRVENTPAHLQMTPTAILFNKSKFKLLEEKPVYFSKIAFDDGLLQKLDGNPVFASFCDRFNAATLAVLQHVVTGEVIIVGALYPTWQPALEPVKTASIRYVLSEISILKAQYKTTKVVFGGDLNIRSDSVNSQLLCGATLSTIEADRISRAYIDADLRSQTGFGVSFQEFFGADYQLNFCNRFGKFTNAMKINSSVDQEVENDVGGYPYKYTIKTPDFVEILDYIFCQDLKVVEQTQIYQPEKFLGDFVCPSDHLYLGAVLQ